MDKIIGALTFKGGTYADAKKDAAFTPIAWLIVVVTALLNALGSGAGLGKGGILIWLLGLLFLAVFAALGFALACWVISLVGKSVFNTTTTFNELVRPLGLARIWHVISIMGLLALISPGLGCVSGFFTLAAAFLGIAAWFMAIHETMALDWVQTITVVVLGVVVTALVTLVASTIFGVMGLGTVAFLSFIK